ncbi:MAG: OmpH family outer membrane protein [Pseudomonadota bacterium]
MLKHEKTLIALLCLALLCSLSWISPGPARAEGQIAVVDMERAVNECAAGKRAQAELKRRAEKLEAELKGLGDEVQRLSQELEKTAPLLKPEAKLSKERDLERKVRLFNDRKRDAQQEIREAQRDAFAPILREMGKVINDLGARQGYSLILEARIALYSPKSSDVTAQVIAAYDKTHP